MQCFHLGKKQREEFEHIEDKRMIVHLRIEIDTAQTLGENLLCPRDPVVFVVSGIGHQRQQ